MRAMRHPGHGTPAEDGEPSGSQPEGPLSHPVILPLGRDEQVAAGVHEVQNALTSVRGWIELARSTDNAEMRNHALRVIENGIERVRSLVARLADPQERFSVRLSAFRMAGVLAEAHEMLHPRCASAGVSLTWQCDDVDVVAQGDAERVMQIVTNLVENAVDAVLAVPQRRDGRGRVEIRVSSDARHVWVDVADDGTGMDDATLARVFEPYFTTHGAADGRRKAGSGLGLAISKALTEAMGGRLEVRTSIGLGTTVTMSLPRDGVLPSLPPVQDPVTQDFPPGTRVLVVDDEPTIRELLNVFLSLRGAEVTVAASLPEARAALAAREYMAVLVDETLGAQQSGAAFVLEQIRQRPSVAHVLMTGAPSVDHLPADAAKHLVRKPFSLDEVVRVIRKAMDSA